MGGVRSGMLPREMGGGDPGPDDLFGDERQKDGQAATGQESGGRVLRYRVILQGIYRER